MATSTSKAPTPAKAPRKRQPRMSASDPNRPENIDNMRRQERAYALFMGSMTFQQIADSPDPGRPGEPLYANKGSAYKAVHAAIQRHTGFIDVEMMRQAEYQRLDGIRRALAPKAMRGDQWSALRYREISETIHKLFGLNAPVRSTIEVLTTDTVQLAIDQLNREIAQQDAVDAVLDGLPAGAAEALAAAGIELPGLTP